MQLHVLKGKPPFSPFRMAALMEKARAAAPALGLARIEAAYVYFVETRETPTADEREKTRTLLDAVEEAGALPAGAFYVTPRKGTISPWSSKAADIFRNCGLENVSRLERGIRFRLFGRSDLPLGIAEVQPLLRMLHDRMTQGVYTDVSDIFRRLEPAPFSTVDILGSGLAALRQANTALGLALNDEEIRYLYDSFKAMNRNPTDVELVMFGQVNSEHCRHKIFRAEWVLDGGKQTMSLFEMIQQTHKQHPEGTLVAYADNAGIIAGFHSDWFEVSRDGRPVYRYAPGPVDIVMKVETHNHPTAISPYPGAATGVGGEIRDEAATGIGGKTKAGLCAFMVSNLRVPGFLMPWEKDFAEFPSHLAPPLDIMTEGPIGGAGFGNEFGRPQLVGIFRTLEQRYNGRYRGYHKPIMVAGGMGNIRRVHIRKKEIPRGACIIQLGGPAMRIGLGGGAASSMDSGANVAELDFNSVQRDNAEMQRRGQEVIDACIALGEKNPILSIHDIGAGGLSNGCPELVAGTGGRFWLRKVPNEETSMSPMEIWCCEAQERYVLAVAPKSLDLFLSLCRRERCPVYVIGEATGDDRLSLHDDHFGNDPIDVDLQVILGRPPRMLRIANRLRETHPPPDFRNVSVKDAVERVLRFPAVANKTFLITIADRTVTGLVARDQMTGPWQTPISDQAVTISAHTATTGEAMAMGERTPLALVSAPASGRMAVGEALTNIAAANIGRIGNVKLSANWMSACGEEGEDANLYDTVRAVALELCPRLGVSIPVGKDSLSMRTVWKASKGREKMTVPLSLVISAFAPVQDVRKTVTADLKPGPDSTLLLLDLGRGQNRLGASTLAQAYNQVGDRPPDVDRPEDLAAFFAAIQKLVQENLIVAYHDRSDGGLFVTLAEMAFGGRTGLEIRLDALGDDDLAVLFSEELGAVIQVPHANIKAVTNILREHGLGDVCFALGHPTADKRLVFKRGQTEIYSETLFALNRMWSELTCHMQARRDNPECAREEFDNLLDESDPGMTMKLTFDPSRAFRAPKARPPMAIFREQGINGQVEMAAAFDRAGFECVDVHMTDLFSGRARLQDFVGLVACGGFSYGDVLGAGSGWARSILYNESLLEMFAEFFLRRDTFALGVCNGCQMMAQLKGIIPGAEDWPAFTRNKSEQFEARFVTVEIIESPSIFFKGMEGSRLGIPVAHGEGFADFRATGSAENALRKSLLAARYVDNHGRPAERYPFNPSGSPAGMTGFTTPDGRVTIMMPHPERAFRSVHLSYRPPSLAGAAGPWLRMFQNARTFAG